MTVQIVPMTEDQAARAAAPYDDGGLGCLRTERGNLPLAAVDVTADITGLVYRVELTQRFTNTHEVPLEATYIFPLPDRAAVTGMRMTAADRVIEAQLQERGQARATYDQAIAAGQRASIAEEERPDVFTMRVGNILPGEDVTVALTLAGPLSSADGAATFRFPLVVAPRYIPGSALPGEQAGDGYGVDTDAVPDASRITPPVLLPGFPNPVRLGIDVGIDPAGLPLGEVRSSLHAVSQQDGRWRIAPGERANRDFVLRLAYGAATTTPVLTLHGDPASDGGGTFELTVLPPAGSAPPRPRDVVLVLDRSGSMQGWKMVSARRAAARIVDTLTDGDRFAVLSFDHTVERPDGLAEGLVAATDRNRFRAVTHLSTVDARGGTEMLAPLVAGRALLTDPERDRVLILVTDGQVGNEDQILRDVGDLRGIRVHTIGIDRAVNAGFLGRLASAGGGQFELVESEDRLDEVMAHIHRRIGAPLVTNLTLAGAGLPAGAAERSLRSSGPAAQPALTGLSIVDGTVAPARLPDLFPGVPLVVRGRYAGTGGAVRVAGTAADGTAWSSEPAGERHDNPAATAIWARAHLRDLEDAYAIRSQPGEDLERRIVATSLRFGVLCRFTAYVAVDPRVVTDGGPGHRVLQPVEQVDGWAMAPAPAPRMRMAALARPMTPMAAPAAMPYAAQAGPPAPAGFAAQGGGAPAAAPMADGAAPRPGMPRPAPPSAGAPPAPGGSAGYGAPTGYSAPPPPPTADLVQRLTRETQALLAELQAAAAAPTDQRYAVLARLGAWLQVTVGYLGQLGVGEPVLGELRTLAASIGARSQPLDRLWVGAQGLLHALVTRHLPAAATPPRPPRRAFWKR